MHAKPRVKRLASPPTHMHAWTSVCVCVCVCVCVFIDDLKLMAESVGELKAALDVLSAFCGIFYFTVNMESWPYLGTGTVKWRRCP